MSSFGNGGPPFSHQQQSTSRWSNDPRFRADPRFAAAPAAGDPRAVAAPPPLPKNPQPPPPFPPSNSLPPPPVPLPGLFPPPPSVPPPLPPVAYHSNNIPHAAPKTSTEPPVYCKPTETNAFPAPTTTTTTTSPAEMSLRDDGDFVEIDQVEWAQNSQEKNLSGELAERPRYEKVDPCGCTPSSRDEPCCVDMSCVLYACQEECGSNCHENCGNRRIQLKQWKSFEVFDAGVKGRGLRATQAIKKDDFITEYVGKAIRKQYLDNLFRRYQNEQMLYIMALDSKTYLDARKKGSNARYINHSCEPNCIVERWRVRGILRAGVFALRDIAVGEELCFDYKWDRKRGRAPTKCHCKSPSCRGTLEMPRSLEEEELDRKLVGHWKVPVSKTPGSSIVNRRIKVLSEEYHEYFPADVCTYDASTKKHLVIYTHDREESWEDLTKEEWMMLDQEAEAFVISRKKTAPTAPSSSLSLLGAVPLDEASREQSKSLKNYMYVQTPAKDALVGGHLVARCEVYCRVKISIIPCSKEAAVTDGEVAQALEASKDGIVWKLVISSGPNLVKAFTFLEKNVLKFQAMQAVANGQVVDVAASNATTGETREVCIPRMIVDHVRRKLPLIRDKCKCVQVNFGASEDRSDKSARLVLEATLVSDLRIAMDVLWKQLLQICSEVNAPKSAVSGIFTDLGFVGGVLSRDELNLLCNGSSVSVQSSSTVPTSSEQEESPESEILDLGSSTFLPSFEASQRCNLWVEPPGTGVQTEENRVTVYFGCDPKDIENFWGFIQARVADIGRGVQYLHLGADKMFQPLLMKQGNPFLSYIQAVTGASVMVDVMTGNHLRIDGGAAATPGAGDMGWQSSEVRSKAAALAEELVRLQIELYRDHYIRKQNWIFGRDWAGIESSEPSPASSVGTGTTSGTGVRSPRPSSPSSRGFDCRAVSNACVEIADVVSNLNMDGNVAAHAAIILYRFVSIVSEMDHSGTQLKTRDLLTACVFLACKAQKVTKFKKPEMILEAAFQTFFPGAQFNKTSQETEHFERRVISAETEILLTLEYDIFWRGSDWILAAASTAGGLSEKRGKKVMEFAFSGPVLGAGATLWLNHGVEYVFAACAAFLSVPLDRLLPALSLAPLVVSQAATLIAAAMKSGFFKRSAVNDMIEGGDKELEEMVPVIRGSCMQIMSEALATNSTPSTTGLSDVSKRFHIIAQREGCRYAFKGVDATVLRDQIEPVIEVVSIESQCNIAVKKSAAGDTADIILEGNWRARAIAEHLLLLHVGANSGFPVKAERLQAELSVGNQELSAIHVKTEPGLLAANAISTIDGWEKTAQSNLSSLVVSTSTKIGGKSCIAGKVPLAAMQEVGLRWWLPPTHGASSSGSVCDMSFEARETTVSNNVNALDRLCMIADAFMGADVAKSSFPALHAAAQPRSRIEEQHIDRRVALSLQRWPPEKVAAREQPRSSKTGRVPMQIGFSPSALQEMQLLTQLHTLVPSPKGHPNFILPVSIAAPSTSGERDKSVNNKKEVLDDDISSLFRSSEEKEKKGTDVISGLHLVCPPTPFLLHRFISRSKKKRGSEVTMSSDLLVAWFHDLLSALVHCHTNNVVIRFFQPDQIYVDHSGVLKLGSLYKATVLSLEEGEKTVNPLKSARKGKEKRDDNSEESSAINDLYVAPEMLLGSKKHTKETDVWSVGCLMAYLLLKKPFFVGKERTSLLLSMFKVVGCPSADNYADGSKFPNYVEPPKKYKRGVKKALEHILKDDADKYSGMIDLLSQMLHLDPRKRISAVEALSHDSMTNFVENSGTHSFQQSFAKEWMSLKGRLVKSSRAADDAARKEQQKLKRKNNFLEAAAAMDDDEDDLYDMNDLLGPSTKKARSEEVA